MKTPPPNIQSITHWLEIATKDLAPSARERITAEIETHYADALETHFAENQSPTDATTRVLDDLGDPYKAAKVYRKKYLTLIEEKEIRKLFSQPRKYWWIGPIYFFLLILVSLMFKWNLSSFALWTSLVVVVGFTLVPFHTRRLFKLLPNRHAAQGLMMIEPLVAGGWLIFMVALPLDLTPWFLKSVYLVSAGYHICHWLNIRSKFSKSSAPTQLQA